MSSTVDMPTRRWIVSSRFDLTILLAPLTVALLSLLAIKGFGIKEPLWAYLIFFVSFDVAHVWGTAYITYLDKEVMKRRRRLLLGVLPMSLLISGGLHAISPTLFWTVLSYVAIYHFIKQQYGFVAMYKARARERNRFDYRLDKWALWTGALGPVVLWHATPRGQFDWFGSGEQFFVTMPSSVQPVVGVVMALTGLLYVCRQLQIYVKEGHFNVGKNMWMLATWVSWFIGIRLADHLFISAAFLNLIHGVPYLGLIWLRCNARWEGKEEARTQLVAKLSQKRNWLIFYVLIFSVAIVEDMAWDGLVWGRYLPELLGVSAPTFSTYALSVLVALLSLPQVAHYILDGFLWKMDGSNPDLKDALGFGR